jgi:hypothetical protein
MHPPEIDVDLPRAGVAALSPGAPSSGRRTLDDLSGRDLVDQQVGKRANLGHRDCWSRGLRRL